MTSNNQIHESARRLIAQKIEGKTIKHVDMSAVNVIRIAFTDGSQLYFDVACIVPGMYGIVPEYFDSINGDMGNPQEVPYPVEINFVPIVKD